MFRIISNILTALLFALTPVHQPTPLNEDARKALQGWQGTWQATAGEKDGVAVPADVVKKQTFFVGVDAYLLRNGNSIVQAGNLQLDASANPPTVDAVVKQGQNKDTTLQGIYSLDGDTLKICFDPQGVNRPKELKTTLGSGLVLATYQRVKSKGETIDITGKYKAESTSLGGQVLESVAVIERRGDAYLVTFTKDDKLIYAAMGIRQGDNLSLSWGNRGQIGVSVYKIEPGPRLTGHYTTVGGAGMLMKEVLTGEKRRD